MKSNHITIQNGTAGYNTAGTGEITLLMLHGNSLSKESFHAQFESSLLLNNRLIALDFPGHGDSVSSAPADEAYSVNGMVSFITDFCHTIKSDNLILFGHSLGGHLAIEAASGLESVRGIIALGTPPLTLQNTGISPFLDHPAIPFLLQGKLDSEQVAILAGSFWGQTGGPPSWISDTISSTNPEFRSSFAKCVATGNFVDEVESLKGFNFPVCMAIGENDALINRDYIQTVTGDFIWNNKVQIITGAGHSAQLENPAETNRIIEQFIQSL